MQIDNIASKRYAEATFNVAKERGALDELESDVKALHAVLEGPVGERLRTKLESPIFLTSSKESVLEKVFEGRVSALVLNTMKILVRRKRTQNLIDVLDEIQKLLDEEHGIFTGTLTTAVEIDDAKVEEITAVIRKTAGEGLQLRHVVNPDIIGGVVVRYKSVLIDDSVKGRLARLAHRLHHIELKAEAPGA